MITAGHRPEAMSSSVTPSTPASAQETGVVVLADRPPQGLPPQARVRRKAEFAQAFAQGKRAHATGLVLYWQPDALPARLGLAVSRKVDRRAVVRNRIKRAWREAFRRLRPWLAGGVYVAVARHDAAQADSRVLQARLQQALVRLGALPASAVLGTMPTATPSSRCLESATSARGLEASDR
jgi:ribonuclease P protein component